MLRLSRVIRRSHGLANQSALIETANQNIVPYTQSNELILSEHETRLVDCIVTLQEEEDKLNASLAFYLEALSESTPRVQRKGRKSQKRKGISDNQVLIKIYLKILYKFFSA